MVMLSIDELPRYESYKDSKSDYSGEIPSTWGLVPIRAIFDERNEKNSGPKTDHILSVTKDRGVIPYDEKGAIGNNKSEDIERYKLVYENDLVINKMNVVIGSLGLSRYFGALSQVYIVLRPKSEKFSIRYYAYLFHNEPFYKSLIRYCTGIMELRESLDKDQFKQLYLPFPVFEDQVLIAQFLDKKTTQIDEAIAIKEQQIALLKERKQIIIQKAVTQGLDPSVPMKDSGVDWIGEIPAHWECTKVSYLAKVDAGATPDRGNPKYWGGSIPWVKTGEVNYQTIVDSEEHISIAGLRYSSLRLAPRGTLLMAMYGQGVTRGRVAILGSPATYNQACCAMTFGDKISPEFAQYFFIAAYPYIRDEGNESSQMNLSAGYISGLKISVPPIDDQKRLIEELDKEESRYSSAENVLLGQLKKLKEYKTTLINSAVTGKIRITPDMVEA